jgi:hypothetical protein
MRRADRASVMSFFNKFFTLKKKTNNLAVKVACKSRQSSERHGLKNIQRNLPKKPKSKTQDQQQTATKQRTSSNRTPPAAAAAHTTKRQAKNSSSRASFPKWVLILGSSSRSGRHPKSAGFSWIAQLRFGPHFLEELGGRSSSSSNNNNNS